MVQLRNGDSIWVYYPTIKRSIRHSFMAVDTGNILNYGDVLALSLAEDYNVTKSEELSDQYVLDLQVKEDSIGYNKVKLYIDKKTLLPKKREYFSFSGDLIKVAEFSRIEQKNGVTTRVEQHISEPHTRRSASIVIQDFDVGEIANTYFNPKNLKNISGR